MTKFSSIGFIINYPFEICTCGKCISDVKGLSSQVVGGDLNANHAIQWQDLKNALNNRIQTGCVLNHGHKDVLAFLDDAKLLIFEKISEILKTQSSLKIGTTLLCNFENVKPEQTIVEVKSFQTKSVEVFKSTALNEWFSDNVIEPLLKEIENFYYKASGWSLSQIINLTTNFSRYAPLQAGLLTFVNIPEDIQKKKAVLNIENYDEFCFLWCITAALCPYKVAHSERTTSYPHFESVLRGYIHLRGRKNAFFCEFFPKRHFISYINGKNVLKQILMYFNNERFI